MKNDYRLKEGDKIICYNTIDPTYKINFSHQLTVGKVYEVIEFDYEWFDIIVDNQGINNWTYDQSCMYYWKHYFKLHNNKPKLLKHLIK